MRTPLLVIFLFLTSCTNIENSDLSGDTHTFFGITKIELPTTDERIEAIRIQSLGLSLGENLNLGWNNIERVTVPLKDSGGTAQPYEATCSIVVIVRSNSEAAHARNILKDIQGDQICLSAF